MNKKILFITDSLSNGGAERQLALLVKYIPDGWDKQVWSLSDGPYKSVIENTNVRLDVCKRSWQFDITPAFNLWRIMKEWSPDIVHAMGWMSAMAAVPVCRAMQIPLVNASIRGGRLPPRRASVDSLSLKLSDGVIANSQAGLSAHGISPDKGMVIYNGFDPVRFKLCNKDADHSTDCFTVIMVGRMTSQKDFMSFIQAALEMSKRDIPAHFIMMGDGDMRPELMRAGEDLVNKGYLSFPEPVPEVIPFLNCANVGVLMTNPSYAAEGISNAIMEYMACGLPVICNNLGGNHEIVIDNETGFSIPSCDVQQLVEKLIYLYQNPIISKKMGQAGYNRILSTFSCEKMVENTVSYYNSIMNLHKSKKNGSVGMNTFQL